MGVNCNNPEFDYFNGKIKLEPQLREGVNLEKAGIKGDTMIIRKIILVGIPLFLMSCAPQSQADRLTLGMVQSSIHGGISGGEVQETLGAPNIISKNKDGNEVWTYDRVSKETTSRGFLFWSSNESTQRTLTVLITFDENGRVTDFTYHSTEF